MRALTKKKYKRKFFVGIGSLNVKIKIDAIDWNDIIEHISDLFANLL